MIAAIMGRISEAAVAGDYRGCPFLNAAAEYPDPASPVRRAIDARRAWYHGVLRELLAADGDPAPCVTASLLVALSDGLLESRVSGGRQGGSPAWSEETLDKIAGPPLSHD